MYRKYDIKVTAKYFRVFIANGYCALGTLIFKWDGYLFIKFYTLNEVIYIRNL